MLLKRSSDKAAITHAVTKIVYMSDTDLKSNKKIERAKIKKVLFKKLILFCISLALTILSDYINTNYTNNSDLEYKKAKCENYIDTEAYLLPEYKEIKISRSSRSIKFNKFKYAYVVDGKEYTFTSTYLSDEPDDFFIKIWYDKNSPSDHEEDDPCIKYEEIKKLKTMDYSDFFIFLLPISFIVLLYSSYSSIKNLFRYLVTFI